MMQLSLSGIAFVAVLLAALGAWYHNMRIREQANRIAAQICRDQSLQLLDGTVALARLRIRRPGPRVERTYVFDYTASGSERASGFIILLGQELRSAGLDHFHPSAENALPDDRRQH